MDTTNKYVDGGRLQLEKSVQEEDRTTETFMESFYLKLPHLVFYSITLWAFGLISNNTLH